MEKVLPSKQSIRVGIFLLISENVVIRKKLLQRGTLHGSNRMNLPGGHNDPKCVCTKQASK